MHVGFMWKACMLLSGFSCEGGFAGLGLNPTVLGCCQCSYYVVRTVHGVCVGGPVGFCGSGMRVCMCMEIWKHVW